MQRFLGCKDTVTPTAVGVCVDKRGSDSCWWILLNSMKIAIPGFVLHYQILKEHIKNSSNFCQSRASLGETGITGAMEQFGSNSSTFGRNMYRFSDRVLNLLEHSIVKKTVGDTDSFLVGVVSKTICN